MDPISRWVSITAAFSFSVLIGKDVAKLGKTLTTSLPIAPHKPLKSAF
jgi:hypothetical protein